MIIITIVVLVLVLVYKSFGTLYAFMVMQIKLVVVVIPEPHLS